MIRGYIKYFLFLQVGKPYRFRVAAFNCAGVGDSSEMPVAVEAMDRFESPEISTDGNMRKTMTVKAGNQIRYIWVIKICTSYLVCNLKKILFHTPGFLCRSEDVLVRL